MEDRMSSVPYNSASDTVVLSQQQFDALVAQSQAPSTKWAVREKAVGDFSETELIMELIGRGYAVSKLPVDEHVEASR
jgi:hypothetical protein